MALWTTASGKDQAVVAASLSPLLLRRGRRQSAFARISGSPFLKQASCMHATNRHPEGSEVFPALSDATLKLDQNLGDGRSAQVYSGVSELAGSPHMSWMTAGIMSETSRSPRPVPQSPWSCGLGQWQRPRKSRVSLTLSSTWRSVPPRSVCMSFLLSSLGLFCSAQNPFLYLIGCLPKQQAAPSRKET